MPRRDQRAPLRSIEGLATRSYHSYRRIFVRPVMSDLAALCILVAALIWALESGWLAGQITIYGRAAPHPSTAQHSWTTAVHLAIGIGAAVLIAGLFLLNLGVLRRDLRQLHGRPQFRPDDVEGGELVVVRDGETLADISRRYYGTAAAWQQIYDTNMRRRQNNGHVLWGWNQELEPGWELFCPGPPSWDDPDFQDFVVRYLEISGSFVPEAADAVSEVVGEEEVEGAVEPSSGPGPIRDVVDPTERLALGEAMRFAAKLVCSPAAHQAVRAALSLAGTAEVRAICVASGAYGLVADRPVPAWTLRSRLACPVKLDDGEVWLPADAGDEPLRNVDPVEILPAVPLGFADDTLVLTPWPADADVVLGGPQAEARAEFVAWCSAAGASAFKGFAAPERVGDGWQVTPRPGSPSQLRVDPAAPATGGIKRRPAAGAQFSWPATTAEIRILGAPEVVVGGDPVTVSEAARMLAMALARSPRHKITYAEAQTLAGAKHVSTALRQLRAALGLTPEGGWRLEWRRGEAVTLRNVVIDLDLVREALARGSRATGVTAIAKPLDGVEERIDKRAAKRLGGWAAAARGEIQASLEHTLWAAVDDDHGAPSGLLLAVANACGAEPDLYVAIAKVLRDRGEDCITVLTAASTRWGTEGVPRAIRQAVQGMAG